MMIRKLSLTLIALILLYALGMQRSGAAAPNLEAPDGATIQDSKDLLSLVVRPSTAQGKDGKLRFAVELINRVDSPITWKSGTNPPFDVRAYTLDGQRLGPPRPQFTEIMERRGGPKDPIFNITLKPMEKKVYTVEYLVAEKPVGTYTVSVAMPLFAYTIGEEIITLNKVVLVHSNEISILVENDAILVQNTGDQTPTPQTLVPVEVASITPRSLSWSLGQELQTKVVRIKFKDAQGRALVPNQPLNHLFSMKVLQSTGQGDYEVAVTPASTRTATAEVLQVEGASIPLDIDVIVGQPQAVTPATKVDTLGAAPADETRPVAVRVAPHVGQSAPHFSLDDMNANTQALSALRGKKNLLLTFFPKCFTGGCANHLSSLRDHQAEFDASNTQVLAVSVDPAKGDKGQKAFAAQWKLPFPLIPDTERKLSMLYGAAQTSDQLAARMTFLIDKQGIVRYIDTNVNVVTHGADMLAKIHELGLDAAK